MQHAALEPDQPTPGTDSDDLPEEDHERNDFGELLPHLDDEDTAVDRHEEDTGPDHGPPTLDDFPDAQGKDDEPENDLDLGPDDVLGDEDEDGAGDALGLDDASASREEQPEDALPSDDEERDGIDDAKPLVSDLELPTLDADDDGIGDLGQFGGLAAGSEAELSLASTPWQLTRLSPERERCSALCLADGTVVAGSTDLLWLDAGRAAPVRVALDGTRILSLILVGEERETALCATSFGRLVRRARFASDSERLAEVGRTPELGGAAPGAVELCQLGPETPRSLIGRAGSGALFRSDDGGITLCPVEPRIVARALSSTGSPATALTHDGKELVRSSDAGKSFERLSLEGPASVVAAGDEPRVESVGSTVALFDSERGLVVSTDGGRTFRDVAGSSSVTAVAVGTREGRASLWLALHAETHDKTRFVEVDAERGAAFVIATLAGTGDGESELGVSARIERLAWDGARLFAAGDAGFFALSPVTAADPRRPASH